MPSSVAGPEAASSHAAGPKTRPFRHGMPSTAARPSLAPGVVVGDRYRIIAKLGEGGMGQVYEAEHVTLPRRVALKVLRPERADAESLARFRQEARATARIGHPGIVDVVDSDVLEGGTLFLAMELLTGRSLEDWLCGPGRLYDAIGWLAAVATALHAAHEAGIVHRDIKPANVFLHDGASGVVPKILDFGIAKVTAADATQIATAAGTLLGTPYYLAPERALGRPLGPRADLYSLGVILYEMLTGSVPFVDDTFMGVLAQHIRTPPLDPRQAAPERGLPARTCALAMRLLDKDPARRPADAAEVARSLHELLDLEGRELRAVTTGPRDLATSGLPTVHLMDVAERPTTAPTDASHGAVLGAAGMPTVRHVGAFPVKQRQVESSPSNPTRLHGSAAVAVRVSANASVARTTPASPGSSGISGSRFDGPVAAGGTARSWPWLVVGGLSALALGGGLVWFFVLHGPAEPRASAPGDGTAPAGTPASSTSRPSVPIASPPVDSAKPPAEPASPPEHEALADPPAPSVPAVRPPPADVVKPSADGDTTDRAASRRRPSGKKPQSAPFAPAAPALKDDVYDD